MANYIPWGPFTLIDCDSESATFLWYFAAYTLIFSDSSLIFFTFAFAIARCKRTLTHEIISTFSFLLFSVVVLYYLLYLPKLVESQITLSDEDLQFYVGEVFSLLFYALTFCNPLIYVYQNRNFRQAFQKLLRLQERRTGQQQLTVNSVSATQHRSKNN